MCKAQCVLADLRRWQNLVGNDALVSFITLLPLMNIRHCLKTWRCPRKPEVLNVLQRCIKKDRATTTATCTKLFTFCRFRDMQVDRHRPTHRCTSHSTVTRYSALRSDCSPSSLIALGHSLPCCPLSNAFETATHAFMAMQRMEWISKRDRQTDGSQHRWLYAHPTVGWAHIKLNRTELDSEPCPVQLRCDSAMWTGLDKYTSDVNRA